MVNKNERKLKNFSKLADFRAANGLPGTFSRETGGMRRNGMDGSRGESE